MQKTINHDGLERLINHELNRLNMTNRADAARFIKGAMGAYDLTGHTIDRSLDRYYTQRVN